MPELDLLGMLLDVRIRELRRLWTQRQLSIDAGGGDRQPEGRRILADRWSQSIDQEHREPVYGFRA